LIAIAIFFFLRRKRRREADAHALDPIGGKAQLHGDSAEVKEMPNTEFYGENGKPKELSEGSTVVEADANDGHAMYEMPANEPPAAEMEQSKP
jgi:hypothetical protein